MNANTCIVDLKTLASAARITPRQIARDSINKADTTLATIDLIAVQASCPLIAMLTGLFLRNALSRRPRAGDPPPPTRR
jgi:hypothetical protein